MSEPKYVTEEREIAKSLSDVDLISSLVSLAQGDDYDGMFTTRGANICQAYEDLVIERLENLRAENAAFKSEIVSKDKKVTDWEIRVKDMLYANKRLRHALEVIADSEGHHDHSLTHSQLIEYAKDALDFVSTEQAISTFVEIKESENERS